MIDYPMTEISSEVIQTTDIKSVASFKSLGLPQYLTRRLDTIGYEIPSEIQSRTIPPLLEGHDLVGQAQTGTGKTAAFALPAISKLDVASRQTQVLVLTPTRELTIQIAQAFESYAAELKNFKVQPIYGGQDYRVQTRALKAGVNVIVSTPGRLMDHMRRGNLSLDKLQLLILDEADEMLRMGFIDDVKWILEQTPEGRQIALFSATMPNPILKIAKRHLQDAVSVKVNAKNPTLENIRQRYWVAKDLGKSEALCRILETEKTDGVLVFVRTKSRSTDLSDRLVAKGIRCSALNGDMQQKHREETVDKLRKGKLDVLVATDVAARGMDVSRITHVVNYDIPYDAETYIHRIGRTGRAGREGDTILFVAPREQRMLGIIEKTTGRKMHKMQMPTLRDVSQQREQLMAEKIINVIENNDLSKHKDMIERTLGNYDIADVAGALSSLLLANNKSPERHEPADRADSNHRERRNNERSQSQPPKRKATKQFEQEKQTHRASPANRSRAQTMPELEEDMERYRLEVGQTHGAEPGKIVGAIANEGGLESQYIGRISIQDVFSLIDLPEGMPKDIFMDLKKTRVCGQALRISRVDSNGEQIEPKAKSPSPKKSQKDKKKPKSRVKSKHKARKGAPKRSKNPGEKPGKKAAPKQK